MRAGGGCDGGARLDISDTMWTELAHVPRLGQVTLVLLSRQWVTFGGGATRLSPTKSGAVPQAGLQGPACRGRTGGQGCWRCRGVGAVLAGLEWMQQWMRWMQRVCVGRVPVGRAVRQGLSFRTRFQERAGLGRAWSGCGAGAIKLVGDSVRGSGLGVWDRLTGRVCGLRGVSALSGDRKGGRGWDAVDGMSWIVSSRTLGRCESLGFFAVAWSLVLRCSRVAVRALSALPAWLVAFRRFRVRVWGLVSRGAGVPRATK